MIDLAPASFIDEVGAIFRFSGGRGVDEAAPETTDYCLSVSASVTPVAVVGVSTSASSELVGFSVTAGSTASTGALGVAVSRGLNQ